MEEVRLQLEKHKKSELVSLLMGATQMHFKTEDKINSYKTIILIQSLTIIIMIVILVLFIK